jgi:hypothetical protein
VTKRKRPEEMERPRRVTSRFLRVRLRCPMCSAAGFEGPTLRVVTYRGDTARMTCEVCELRFSVGVPAVCETALERIQVMKAVGLNDALRERLRDDALLAWEAHLRAIGQWAGSWEEQLGWWKIAATLHRHPAPPPRLGRLISPTREAAPKGGSFSA